MTTEKTQAIERRDKNGQAIIPVVEQASGAVLHGFDMRAPSISIIQNSSPAEQGPKGRFWRPDTGETFESITVMPVMIRPTRILWPEGPFERGRKALCFSGDGQRAAEIVGELPALYPGAACTECPKFTMQPWKEKGNAGWCSPGYTVAFMTPEGEGILMRLTGTATKVARIFAGRNVFRKAFITLTTDPMTSNVGSWYALRTNVAALEAEPAWVKGADFSDWNDFTVEPPQAGDDDGAGGQGQGPDQSHGAETLTGMISFVSGISYVGANGTALWKAYIELEMPSPTQAVAGAKREQLIAWGKRAERANTDIHVLDVMSVQGEWRDNDYEGDAFYRDFNLQSTVKLNVGTWVAPGQPAAAPPTPPEDLNASPDYMNQPPPPFIPPPDPNAAPSGQPVGEDEEADGLPKDLPW